MATVETLEIEGWPFEVISYSETGINGPCVTVHAGSVEYLEPSIHDAHERHFAADIASIDFGTNGDNVRIFFSGSHVRERHMKIVVEALMVQAIRMDRERAKSIHPSSRRDPASQK